MKEKSLLKGRGRENGVGRTERRRERKKKGGGEEGEGKEGGEDEEGEQEEEEGEEEEFRTVTAMIEQPGPCCTFTIPASKEMLFHFAVTETKAQRGKEFDSRWPSEDVVLLETHQRCLVPSSGLPQLPHEPQLIP